MAASVGPLDGVRVVEVSGEWTGYPAKLLSDMGADVTVVEPPGGAPTRAYGPFVDDEPGPERSLFWWAYNAGKHSVVLDLDADADRERLSALVAQADVLIESEPPGRMAARGLDWATLSAARPELVMASITPFGQVGPRADEPVTDLTILAGGGPVWSCGYDDHSLPPVRGGGNQATHIGGHYAVMSALTALLHREISGRGQHIDVNMHAAANVTTEFASYGWLAAEQTVQRQTGRHAAARPTPDTQLLCGDGRWLNTGVPPRSGPEFKSVLEWLRSLGVDEEFPLTALLEMGSEIEHMSLTQITEDPMIGEIFMAGRDALMFIAARIPAYDAFIGLQERGIPVGVIYAPEEVMTDPQFVARGFPTEIEHEDLGLTVTYPGAPYRFTKTPWKLRGRPPHVGEHNDRLPAPR